MKKRFVVVIVCVLTAAALMAGSRYFLGASGSEDDTYVMKVGDTKISPEVYRVYLVHFTQQAGKQVSASSAEEFWKQTIEDKPVSEWVRSRAKDQIIRDIVIQDDLNQEDPAVSDADKERQELYLSQLWENSRSLYTKNQCEKQTFDAVFAVTFQMEAWYQKYQKEHPAAENQPSVPTATVKYFMMNLYGLDGNRFTEAQESEIKKLADPYVRRIQNGTSIDTCYRDYRKKTEEILAENRPLASSVISADQEEYTEKIPNFVKALLQAKAGEAFAANDRDTITVGIRENDTNNPTIRNAYQASAEQKAQRKEFDADLAKSMAETDVTEQEALLQKLTPEQVIQPELSGGEKNDEENGS